MTTTKLQPLETGSGRPNSGHEIRERTCAPILDSTVLTEDRRPIRTSGEGDDAASIDAGTPRGDGAAIQHRSRRLSHEQLTSARRELEALVSTFETNRPLVVVDCGVGPGAAYDIGVKAAVEESLIKLDRGTYGTCDQCGDPIDADRLQLVPFARRCMHCQRVEADSWNEIERLIASIVAHLVGEPQGRQVDLDRSQDIASRTAHRGGDPSARKERP